MPKALAIETSGRVGSIAIVDSGRVLDESTFAHGLQHAAGILVIIDELVKKQGWRPGDIEQVYVSAGPGSFTGLRVGITVAKTLALALAVKIVAVPTVNVLALNAPEGWRELVIVLDAKRGQIYTARFVREGGRPKEVEPAHLDSLAAMLERSSRPVHLLGEGVPYHRKFISAEDAAIIITPEDLWRARASRVARVGWEMAQPGAFADPERLTPIYIRRPEAEEKWEQLGKR